MWVQVPFLAPAGMAELVDALDSGSSEDSFMKVQVLLPAPKTVDSIESTVFLRNKSYWICEMHSVRETAKLTSAESIAMATVSADIIYQTATVFAAHTPGIRSLPFPV